jgi:hypothetical protein
MGGVFILIKVGISTSICFEVVPFCSLFSDLSLAIGSFVAEAYRRLVLERI